MNALFYAINITTLATWLSVVGISMVAGFIPAWHPEPTKQKLSDTFTASEDFVLGLEEELGEQQLLPPTSEKVESPINPLPAPPELPNLTDTAPLPELPSLPAPQPKVITSSASATSSQPTSNPASTAKPLAPAKSKPSSNAGHGAGTIKTTGGNIMSESARIAGGTMKSPIYPALSRRNKQTGTVIVEFTVDTTGRVISAVVKSSSHWPLLDNEAVRAVRKWKFPPGPVMKLQRPIIFKLK